MNPSKAIRAGALACTLGAGMLSAPGLPTDGAPIESANGNATVQLAIDFDQDGFGDNVIHLASQIGALTSRPSSSSTTRSASTSLSPVMTSVGSTLMQAPAGRGPAEVSAAPARRVSSSS